MVSLGLPAHAILGSSSARNVTEIVAIKAEDLSTIPFCTKLRCESNGEVGFFACSHLRSIHE